jgi:hypothetical protein
VAKMTGEGSMEERMQWMKINFICVNDVYATIDNESHRNMREHGEVPMYQ